MRVMVGVGLIGLALVLAPAAVAQSPSWTVYFGTNSTTVDAKSKGIIDKALPQIRKCANNGVRVIGHTDLSYSMQEASELAIGRAKAVRDYLVAKGIADGSIAPMSKSHAEPAVPTADGVKEPKNNRVEIKLVCD
jgi:OmpA-OmpF porin, OOP family